MTKLQRLQEERRQLGGTYDPENLPRVAAIDREIEGLKRRAQGAKLRRELLFDLNGHHGRA